MPCETQKRKFRRVKMSSVLQECFHSRLYKPLLTVRKALEAIQHQLTKIHLKVS